MKAVVRLIDVVSIVCGYIGAWILAPLILSMVYEVFARHVFNAPTFWAYEVGYMLAGSSYMLGFSYCMQVKGHVRVDFLYSQMGPRMQALIDVIGFGVFLLPAAIWLTYGLIGYTLEAYAIGEVSGESAWNPVIWPFRTVWIVGFVAISLQGFGEVMKALMVLLGDPYEESAA
jgi:TRAP-type mannitol/chloroaromatic compound transport system permease small subunit